MKKVYLAGPIFQCEDPMSWRYYAAEHLPAGWQAVDPLLFEVDEKLPTKLVAEDLRQMTACNAVLVRAEQASWGTAMEIFHAHQRGMPVLAWPCFLERSPWLTAHVTEFFGTLKEAVAGLKHHG